MSRRQVAAGLVASHLAALGVGYASRGQAVDTEVKHDGYFTTTATHVLSTTVESLREENKLLVMSYKGTATVEVNRTFLIIFGGHQELVVPVVVPFYLPLADFNLANVAADERAHALRVRLPALTLGDVAFQPEQARTVSGGLLSFSEAQVEALRKLAYAKARWAVVAQAQQPGFLHAAQTVAIKDVEQYLTLPLRAAGLTDIQVAAYFP